MSRLLRNAGFGNRARVCGCANRLAERHGGPPGRAGGQLWLVSAGV